MTTEVFSTNQQIRDWLHLNDLIEEEGGQVPCRQAPDLYFPEKIGNGYDNAHTKLARNACLTSCPILNQCRDYAIKHRESYGIWGGMTLTERKRLWK